MQTQSLPLSGIKVAAVVSNVCIVDTRVIKQAEGLASEGAEVRVFCRHERGLKRMEEINNVTYYRVPFPQGSVPALLKTVPKFIIRLLTGNIRLFQRSSSFARDIMHYLKYDFFTYVFSKLIVDFKPTIIHCHDFTMVPLGVKCREKTDAKVIFDAHEIEIDKEGTKKFSGPSKYTDKLIYNYFPYIDGFVTTNSSALKFYLDRYGPIDKPSAIVYNTPIPDNNNSNEKIEVEDVRKKINFDNDKKLLVYTGGIGVNRGVEETVEALVSIPDVHFCILGLQKQDILGRFNAYVKSVGMEDRVYVLPPVPHEHITETIKTADASVIFIKPSCLNYYYCSPNKLFESLLAGLPIIVSDLPEMKKLVEEKGVGIATEAENVSKLTDSIQELLANTERYKPSMEKLEAIKNEYGWEAQKSKLITLYQQVLGGTQPY